MIMMKSLNNKSKKIRKDNPNYEYRRIHAMLRRLGVLINKKKSSKTGTKAKASGNKLCT